MIFTSLLVVVVLFAGALAIPAPGRGALTGHCITSEHCEANDYCLSFNRTMVINLSPYLKRLVEGKCKPMLGRGAGYCYAVQG